MLVQSYHRARGAGAGKHNDSRRIDPRSCGQPPQYIKRRSPPLTWVLLGQPPDRAVARVRLRSATLVSGRSSAVGRRPSARRCSPCSAGANAGRGRPHDCRRGRQRYGRRCYNARVRKNSNLRRHSARVRSVETLGVILIAILIFLITLARFVRTISWSKR